MNTKTPIVRHNDWEIRLTEYLLDCIREKITLDWEFFDCGYFACGAIEVMTGADLYAPFRGNCGSPQAAYKAIKKAGYDTIEDIAREHFEEKPLVLANKGDLILAPARSASDLTDYSLLGMPYALAIAEPPFFWALSEQGLGRAPILTAHKAFGVGV